MCSGEAKRIALAGAVLALVVAGLGCISSHSKTTYGENGPPVGTGTLRQVRCGETTKDWVLAAMGEPTRHATPAPGEEVLEYRYVKNTEGRFSMAPPFISLHDEKEQHTTVVFEVSNGVVVNYWKK